MERHIDILIKLFIYYYNSLPGSKWSNINTNTQKYCIKKFIYDDLINK